MLRPVLFFALAAGLWITGCHSAYIEATVSNRTPQPLTLLEVDYPSASFGTQNLAPGQNFHYRFKILGSGATTIVWTDATQHDHKNSGPQLLEGEEGNLNIVFTPDGSPTWNLRLSKP